MSHKKSTISKERKAFLKHKDKYGKKKRFTQLTPNQFKILARLAKSKDKFTDWERDFIIGKEKLLRDLIKGHKKFNLEIATEPERYSPNGILDKPFKPKTILLKKSKELIDMDREVKDIASLSKLT